MPEEFLLGRVFAKNIVDPETGEIVVSANDEVTEEVLVRLRAAGIKNIQTLYINDLDQGAFISQTLRADETADEMSARIAIYRMMRPGEPPTEDAVQALFHRLFYNPDAYDLSKVGRMKFNRRVGRTEATGTMTLYNDDLLSVFKTLVDLRTGRGEVDAIDHLGNSRVPSAGCDDPDRRGWAASHSKAAGPPSSTEMCPSSGVSRSCAVGQCRASHSPWELGTMPSNAPWRSSSGALICAGSKPHGAT